MRNLYWFAVGLCYGLALAALLYRKRVRRLIEQASEQMTRADHAEAALARAQLQPVRDYPRPLGAPHVTPPVGSQWQCRCGQCVTKRLVEAAPRRPLYDYHDGPLAWFDVDSLPVVAGGGCP